MGTLVKFLKKLPMNCNCTKFSTPVGTLTLINSENNIYYLAWLNQSEYKFIKDNFTSFSFNKNDPYTQKCKNQLNEYFCGKRKKFDLNLSVEGTDFQKLAWNELKKIPYGKTISYQEQAIKLGDKNKVRAVGSSNGKNPISIIVPCHRVIAKNGSLHGFGGGLENKKRLLDLEQKFM